MEGLVLFEDVENALNNSFDEASRQFTVDLTPTTVPPRKDSFRFTSLIGDAEYGGNAKLAPAWKVVSLNGAIGTSSIKDVKNDINIPQININLDYKLSVKEYDPQARYIDIDLTNTVPPTDVFSDSKIIQLETEHLMIYAEEENTELLVENFEIEIFEIDIDGVPKVCDTCDKTDKLIRKYFLADNEKIMGGLMTEKSQVQKFDDVMGTRMFGDTDSANTGSVGYYFNVLKDYEINEMTACKASEIYNKQSYYISLDFDCTFSESEYIPDRIDIYGPTTEPEICQ